MLQRYIFIFIKAKYFYSFFYKILFVFLAYVVFVAYICIVL